MLPLYEKQAYDVGHKEGYDEGYRDGHLSATAQYLREQREEVTRQGILQGMKEHYELKLQKAYAQGRRSGQEDGYHQGYLAGKADGYQEGAARGRRERVEEILRPGESVGHAAARLQAAELARQEMAAHLGAILAQVKEGGAIAAAIAGRIEEAIQHWNEKV